MNRGQLVTRVARKMGLSTAVASDDLQFLQDMANDAVIETLLRTHINIHMGDMTLHNNVAEYRLDSNILAVDDGRGSTPAGIGNYEIVSLEEMIRRQSTGYVTPTWRKVIAFDGDLLIVSPTPATSEVLRFYYVPRPTTMLADATTTADANDPATDTYGGIPSQYHRALEYYMLWQAAEHVEKQVPLGPLNYFQLFEAECQLINDRKRQMVGRRLTRAVVGYPDARQHPTRNDVYPSYDSR